MRDRDGFFDRLAKGVDHKKLTQPLAMREAEWVHEQRYAQPRQSRIERIEGGIRQFEFSTRVSI